ncbi:MAG: Fic family protein [Edaphobacter sp.]
MKPAIAKQLPILTPQDWLALIPAMGQANRSLAEYKGRLRRLPNSDLLLSPLRLQEAVLSSRIEGTLATMSEVLQFEAGELPERESRRQDIEEILNYRLALDTAMQELKIRPFNLNLLLRLHRILLQSVRGQNKAPGEFRRQQNYVGSRVGGIEKIRFTPPEWTTLAGSLSNWEKYYHSDEEAVVRLALIHAQFEFLHPFLDGNGRLGRILIPIFLFEHDLLSQPTFYLSEYLEEHREEYIERLNDLGRAKNAWRHWTQFFLTAVSVQAKRNIDKADAILALYESLKQRFIGATSSKYAVPLLDSVFELQYFQAGQLQWQGNAPSKPTVMTMLQALEREKLIRVYRDATGRRPAIWWIPELTTLFDATS